MSVFCRDTGHQWTVTGAGALGTADLGVAYDLVEEVAINLTREPPELTQDWGNRLLEGTNRNLWAPGPRERSSDPDLTVSVQESPADVWVGGGLLQGGGH